MVMGHGGTWSLRAQGIYMFVNTCFLRAARREQSLTTACEGDEYLFTRGNPLIRGATCPFIWESERSSTQLANMTKDGDKEPTPICHRKIERDDGGSIWGQEPQKAFYGIFKSCDDNPECAEAKIDNVVSQDCRIGNMTGCCTPTNSFNSMYYGTHFVYIVVGPAESPDVEKRHDLLAVTDADQQNCYSKFYDTDLWHFARLTSGDSSHTEKICYRKFIADKPPVGTYRTLRIMSPTTPRTDCVSNQKYLCSLGGWTACCSKNFEVGLGLGNFFTSYIRTVGGECRDELHVFSEDFQGKYFLGDPVDLQIYKENKSMVSRKIAYAEYGKVAEKDVFSAFYDAFCFTRTGEPETCTLGSTRLFLHYTQVRAATSGLNSCTVSGMHACCTLG
eukprot:TRINITY_DN6920_c0_g2_i1.p1 TRINITY_DN6920_c0_g2~~TRINITY_DN6920_c0_g2_i1.p1  ORF type:complete len:399 (-),score=18.19 TRINITY_DN6920_c0_g2_i1:304-1473(-)